MISLFVAVMFNAFDGCETAWIEREPDGAFYGACGDTNGRDTLPRPNPVSLAIDTSIESAAWLASVATQTFHNGVVPDSHDASRQDPWQ